MNRKTIFDAIKDARGGKPFNQMEVGAVDNVLDALGVPRVGSKRVSKVGIDLIKQFEGMKLKAYPDPGSGGEPWTIGIGTTVYPAGKKVRPGDVITEAQAEEYLAHDLRRFEDAVNKFTGGVTTQSQFDAMVSFAYNVGEEALRTSTLLRKHNEGDYEGAAQEFKRWNKASGKVLAGLTRRRDAEASLYRS